ncbi:hypothetical protein ACU4GD_03680 [Cupriavidus basilensis]
MVTLELPPLRERREDVPPLFEHFRCTGSAAVRARGPARHSATGWPR